MLRKLYALLVGINAYPSTVGSLSGCVNDVQNMEAFLEGWVDRNSFQFEIKKLIDEQATRNNIVEGFRTHLCQATSSDVALFFFAGHGSQERTLPQLLHFEPDRLDETLVCWDSRQNSGWDLADKELAWLIAEVSNKNPHIVIILDCCHSGSGTRQEHGKIRRISKQTKSRPEDSYLFNIEEFVQTKPIDFSETPSGWSLGNKGRHVLLAACESGQTAKEYTDKEGKNCGTFSYFLIETLNKSNGQLTYKELMTHTSALVCRVTSEQTPQLEAPTREDINRFFLDGALAQRLPHFTVRYDKNYEWCLDAGKIHGLPDVKSSEPIRIALYPFNASGTDLEKVSNAIAFGKITKVLPHQSRVEIEDSKLSVNDTFKAVIVSLPLEPFGIFLSGEECGLSNLRQAIKGRAIGRGNARFVQEVVNVNDAKLSVKAVENRYSIRDLVTDKIAAEVADYSNTELVVTYLENIVCWHNILADLDSQTKTLQDNAVELKVYQNSSEINLVNLLELSYTYEGGVWHRPSFRLKLKNNYHKRLYCSLIGLSEDYSVTSSFLPNGGIWLEPGEEAWAYNGNPIRTKVLDSVWKKGGTITRDWLRLIVSTDEFDAGLLDQKPLEAVTTYSRGLTRSYRHKNRLNWLLNRYVTRHFDLDDELYSKWTTKLLSITTTRLQESVSFQENNHGSRSAIIQHEKVKCVVEAPMNLEAELRLASKIEKNRSTLPDILQEGIFDKPLEFVLPQGSSPALNIIELDNICNPKTVATSTPLSITVNFDNKETMGLDDNSNMLAVGYNGEFYIPLGLAKSTEQSVNLTLSHLPGVAYQAERSVRQSLYLFFQKFLAKPMGVDYQYPHFALAEIMPNNEICYHKDTELLQEKLKLVKEVTLCIGGLVGSIDEMVRAVKKIEGVDLVLVFEYETLTTPIEQVAIELKDCLEKVGLTVDRGKFLRIVAYSLGGLVARWFIEREQGYKLVYQLIMIGTPNVGTPWPTVQFWATLCLALSVNILLPDNLSLEIISGLLTAMTEKYRLTFNQVEPQSQFLKTLNTSPETDVSYTVIAGNSSILSQNGKETSEETTLKRLMIGLGLKELFCITTVLPFFTTQNDTVATIESMTSFPSNWIKKPCVYLVDCNHLNYFNSISSIQALTSSLTACGTKQI